MYIADFHIHSKYSRATSREMDIAHISESARIKGIGLVGTGDFTHPDWLRELKENLSESGYGIYRHKGIDYILTAEINSIYTQLDRVRKVHSLIFAPSFEAVDKINDMLSSFGSLFSDGRPIVKLGCQEMIRRLMDIDLEILLVPAHVWTPHFGVFGANSGFDRIEDCFGEEVSSVYSLETGLSSDPPMNWRWSSLDRFCLISNSDAHSPSKLGREANVFNDKIGYKDLIDILKKKDSSRFLYTIEFFPEEGKYHWDGHRKCGLRLSPEESKNINNKCPNCGAKVTVGVMSRVNKLSDREEDFVLEGAPSYKSLIPLAEIIANALGAGTDTVGVLREYNKIVSKFGNEFRVLIEEEEDSLRKECHPRIAQGIMNVRKKNISIMPGYDGEYGSIDIFGKDGDTLEKQLELF